MAISLEAYDSASSMYPEALLQDILRLSGEDLLGVVSEVLAVGDGDIHPVVDELLRHGVNSILFGQQSEYLGVRPAEPYEVGGSAVSAGHVHVLPGRPDLGAEIDGG